jgi:hypothetical protein
MFSICRMADDNPRHARFLRWFVRTFGEDGADARRKFIEASACDGKFSPYTKGRVSQLLSGTDFLYAAGKNIAERFGLPENYFERDAGPVLELSTEALAWAARYDKLTESERRTLELLWQVAREGHAAEQLPAAKNDPAIHEEPEHHKPRRRSK